MNYLASLSMTLSCSVHLCAGKLNLCITLNMDKSETKSLHFKTDPFQVKKQIVLLMGSAEASLAVSEV